MREGPRGAYAFSGFGAIATWGSQSWLQPPFEAASLLVSKVSALQQQDPLWWPSAEPPRKAAAAKIGCPTSQSPQIPNALAINGALAPPQPRRALLPGDRYDG